jgi:hypothetical protein
LNVGGQPGFQFLSRRSLLRLLQFASELLCKVVILLFVVPCLFGGRVSTRGD